MKWKKISPISPFFTPHGWKRSDLHANPTPWVLPCSLYAEKRPCLELGPCGSNGRLYVRVVVGIVENASSPTERRGQTREGVCKGSALDTGEWHEIASHMTGTTWLLHWDSVDNLLPVTRWAWGSIHTGCATRSKSRCDVRQTEFPLVTMGVSTQEVMRHVQHNVFCME